jgi:TonB family protein
LASPAPNQAQSLPNTANTPGQVQNEVLPDVSQNARQSMHELVKVIVRASVDRDGTVKSVAYISPGEGNYFARTAARAAHLWKFTPPERNGRAQPSIWILHFTFLPSKTEVQATKEGR